MDTDLVVRAQQGDKRAYGLIATEIADRFLSVSGWILHDLDLAEDATQEALLSIWRDLPQLREPERFDAWSYRLLLRACEAEGRREPSRVPNPAPQRADDLVLGDDHRSVGQLLNDTLALLDGNRQRRSWGPAWRFVGTTGLTWLALGTAAAVVVAVAALNLLPRVTGVDTSGLGSPSPLSSPTPTLPSSPTPTVDPLIGGYTIGPHSLTVDGVPFSLTVPASGWELFDGIHLSKSAVPGQDAEAVIYWSAFPHGALADWCGQDGPPGSAAALAATVATAEGTELVSGPSDVSLDGHAAKQVVLIVREDVGCDPGFFYNWKAKLFGALWTATKPGDTISVWIVEVDGALLFIGGVTKPYPSQAGWTRPEELALEIETIVSSIHFT